MINIVLNQKKNLNTRKEKSTYSLVCKKTTDNKNIKGVALEKNQ